ncbi:hypothetical protein CDO52_24775 [Nocardiopsis gilva YIM 90087]|uniref:Uncharacterized protein n=1 Tax=Nocardiopsis gilva YIM 90087 TaxID=1235441 RepID=A0A223SBR0_9ACTN|nr:hypothetical protein [Nocardiopsis gilva]ASU85587.1 hypothetical protein CDO52_24775 [Nocardiopsis gilva YIM 90087]
MPGSVRPEEILPDGDDHTVLDGLTVRKGTVAAFVANVKALDGVEEGSAEWKMLADRIRELVPGVRAVGLFDVLTPKSPQLRNIIDEASTHGGTAAP